MRDEKTTHSALLLRFTFLCFYYTVASASHLQLQTVSRNVAIKSAKLAESAFAGQSDVLRRQVATKALSSDEADFEDFGRNVVECWHSSALFTAFIIITRYIYSFLYTCTHFIQQLHYFIYI